MNAAASVIPTCVVDASVAVKWFVPQNPAEADSEIALALLDAYADGRIRLMEPPIWRAEVAAVLARLLPDPLESQLARLWALDYHSADSEAVLIAAGRLAVTLNHHLFDTLYHATALSQPNAALVTADERYFSKAAALGQIVRLRDWSAPCSA
ncbi:MAG TPA: type II toxin-antitoxin system VapC family toxin [Candidatus Contendobacter sp.]|jgi:predicted nucleic acid-binding protein|nr:type II toxin-antitoxin system VapC family toxin [Candidatus Contendobacter sp.]HRZ22777.1 type II toxin-antitoxin system VapC family toxin [Candidatus Contendobacter sp.]HRZ51768.1 type II toxin-antitoxin system VapC family toxin [Candidatus Contendobacter sp.]